MLNIIISVLSEDGSLFMLKFENICFNFYVCNKCFVFGNLLVVVVNNEMK